jgi:hypothetical protein
MGYGLCERDKTEYGRGKDKTNGEKFAVFKLPDCLTCDLWTHAREGTEVSYY